jgi:hypothetical protein
MSNPALKLPRLPAGSDGTVSIQLRARLTLDEYRELRVIAARTSTPVADLVAAALRVAYPLTQKEDSPA